MSGIGPLPLHLAVPPIRPSESPAPSTDSEATLIGSTVSKTPSDTEKQHITINTQKVADPPDPSIPENDLQIPSHQVPPIKYKKISWQVWLITIADAGERFAFWGALVLITNFVQYPLPGNNTGAGHAHNQSGALNMGQSVATAVSAYAQLWSFVTPMFGGFVADYLGKKRSLWIFSSIALVGYIILIFAAIPPVIVHSGASFGLLLFSIFVWGLGAGSCQPIIYAMVGEQETYDTPEISIEEKQQIEKGVIQVDEQIKLPNIDRVYSIFYSGASVGALLGGVGPAYVERFAGFWWAYLLGAALFCKFPVMIWLARKHLKEQPATGSAIPSVLRILQNGFRGTFNWNPIKWYRRVKDGTFWSRSYPSNFTRKSRPKWMVFDDRWVDEVRRGAQAAKVCMMFPIFSLAYTQINNNLVSQGNTLNDTMISSDVFSNAETVFLVILLPLLEFVIYPGLRKLGIELSTFKRIWCGFMFASTSMLYAAILQRHIYATSSCGSHASDCQEISTPIWAQVPSYALLGAAEATVVVPSIDYAFRNAPVKLRTVLMAFFMLQIALGGVLTEVFAPLSSDPYLIWNYSVICVLTFIGGNLFYWSFRDLERQEKAMMALVPGKVGDKSFARSGNSPADTPRHSMDLFRSLRIGSLSSRRGSQAVP